MISPRSKIETLIIVDLSKKRNQKNFSHILQLRSALQSNLLTLDGGHNQLEVAIHTHIIYERAVNVSETIENIAYYMKTVA